MALKLSYEPAITATVTAGLVTAAGVGAALNAADMPAGWDWMETWVPLGLFLAYLLVGLVIRPLVTPNVKVRDAARAERLTMGDPSNVRRVPGTSGNYTTGGYPGGDGGGALPPPSGSQWPSAGTAPPD